MSNSYQIALPSTPAERCILPAAIGLLSLWWRSYTIWHNRQLAVAALQRLGGRLPGVTVEHGP